MAPFGAETKISAAYIFSAPLLLLCVLAVLVCMDCLEKTDEHSEKVSVEAFRYQERGKRKRGYS